ncbi:MAG: outer membrane beta-barrel protein [Proteobacteria bacterium]|nr:outer membrane beta-barrel protein [Pseudomonadota bacterium]
MRRITLGIIAAALLLGGAAGAQEGDVYSREGGYAGLAAVGAVQTQLGDQSTNWGGGLNGRVGWRGTRWFAFEIQSEFIAEFNDTSTRAYSFTGNAKVPIPLGIVEPYALAGMGLLYTRFKGTNSGDNTAFVTRWGVGVDIYTTKNWVVSTEAAYVLPVGSGRNLDYVSLGIGFLYRLDGPTL